MDPETTQRLLAVIGAHVAAIAAHFAEEVRVTVVVRIPRQPGQHIVTGNDDELSDRLHAALEPGPAVEQPKRRRRARGRS